MNSSISVNLEGVTVRVQDKYLVEDVNLKLGVGERVVLLGRSGAGKTTVLRVIAGFEDRINKGRVEVGGGTAFENGKSKMFPHEREIAMLFQDLALWPHLNVKQHLWFPLRKMGFEKKELEARVAEILEAMGISNRKQAKPAELSGGEQQRLALARALIAKPRVLLLDEPFSSLDLPLKKEMMELVLSSHEKYGFTLVHVTHDPQEAARIANRIILMESGKITWTGHFEELLRSKQPQQKELFDALKWLSEAVRSGSDAE